MSTVGLASSLVVISRKAPPTFSGSRLTPSWVWRFSQSFTRRCERTAISAIERPMNSGSGSLMSVSSGPLGSGIWTILSVAAVLGQTGPGRVPGKGEPPRIFDYGEDSDGRSASGCGIGFADLVFGRLFGPRWFVPQHRRWSDCPEAATPAGL